MHTKVADDTLFYKETISGLPTGESSMRMAYVYRPVKPSPKLLYTTLSPEAQKTLEDLQRKYSSLLSYVQTQDVSYHDPANYYKSIYNASFRKCFSTTYSKKSPDGNSEIPACKQIIEKPLTFSSENNNIFDTKSSMEYAHHTLISSKFEKKGSKVRPENEVFLKYRPSDEEIADSILQLTQRTSHPDSPCLDLNCDLEGNKQFDSSASEHLVSRDQDLNNCFDSAYLSPPTNNISRSESFCQPDNCCKGHYPIYKELYNHVKGQKSPKTTTRVMVQNESEITGCISVINEVIIDHSPVILSSVDDADVLCTNKNDTTEGKHKHASETNGTLDHQKVKDTLKAVEVADFELSLSDFECSQSYNSQHISEGCFLKRTDTCITQHCFKDSSEQSESPFEKDTLAANKCHSISSSKDDDESPHVESTEANQTSQTKPGMETSTSVQDTNKITGCDAILKNDNLFQSVNCKKESSSKDYNQTEKRRSEQHSSSSTKKFKPYFRPPFKENVALNTESEILISKNSRKQLGTSVYPALHVVSFSSLSLEKQRETLNALECSRSLVLTMLYNTSQTLMTTFYSAADYAKKKNSLLQPTMVGIVILDEDSTSKSFLIPSELICRDDIKATLLCILVSANITKTIANCKEFLINVRKLYSLNSDSEHGIPCENIEDPVIACWLVDPDNQPASFMQMCRTAGVEQIYDDSNWLAYLQMAPKLMHSFRKKLKANKLWSVFTLIEMKLIPVLACMETRTIKVDTALFVKFSDILKSKIKKLEETVYKEARRKFSINSHVQLRQILYEELELDKNLPPDIKITKTDVSNQKSTCESSLKLLAAVHPLPALVLEYRQMQKLMSTYVDGMMSCVTNGSIMTHWDQTAAATGRLTSSQPNIQAVPKTVITVTDFQTTYVIGSEMSNVNIHAREPFISRPGYVFLAADFQQTELRVLAHLSGDSSLQSLFKNTTGEDVFISLTKQWQNKTSKEVTSADREQTKRVVYSVMYGAGKDKLSEYLKVKPDVAQDIITSFLLQFPAIGSFTKKCWTYAQEFGYTETVSGRRRYFPHINSSSPVLRAQAQRQAVNFCVQGSAADICKLAMLAVEGQLQETSHLSCKLLLQIHDELIWEVSEDQLLETKDVIQKVLEDPETFCGTLFTLQVPLTVAFSSGKSWAHMDPCK
ncbi:hypothetical protein BsWGS_05443 [Bradybaena similaris]